MIEANARIERSKLDELWIEHHDYNDIDMRYVHTDTDLVEWLYVVGEGDVAQIAAEMMREGFGVYIKLCNSIEHLKIGDTINIGPFTSRFLYHDTPYDSYVVCMQNTKWSRFKYWCYRFLMLIDDVNIKMLKTAVMWNLVTHTPGKLLTWEDVKGIGNLLVMKRNVVFYLKYHYKLYILKEI